MNLPEMMLVGPYNPFLLGDDPLKEWFWREMRAMHRSAHRAARVRMVLLLLNAKFDVPKSMALENRFWELTNEALEAIAVGIVTAESLKDLGLEEWAPAPVHGSSPRGASIS